MNIVQITPGAGPMYCGNCFRDNALVAAWRKLGHHALMLPLYLPMTLEEEDQSAGAPIFFGGINVYLEQKFSWWGRLPRFLHQMLDAPVLLRLVAGSAAKTRPADVGDLTVSMLQGELGQQASELDHLVKWLRDHEKPDVICLSNGLLTGLARRLKAELKIPVICMFQGEDYFLDSLPKTSRESAWRIMAERAGEIDVLVSPSAYYGALLEKRLGLTPGRFKVVHNGIDPEGYAIARQNEPIIGYFARMCPEKGLDTLIEAFLSLCRRNSVPGLRLHIGGGVGPVDQKFVELQKAKLLKAGFLDRVRFFPNVTKEEKQSFFSQVRVFSVPALYGEAFGLYLLEAWASGVPVVQPRHAAFPELIEKSGAGLLCEPGNVPSLAEKLEAVLKDATLHGNLAKAGPRAIQELFTAEKMAADFLAALGNG